MAQREPSAAQALYGHLPSGERPEVQHDASKVSPRRCTPHKRPSRNAGTTGANASETFFSRTSEKQTRRSTQGGADVIRRDRERLHLDMRGLRQDRCVPFVGLLQAKGRIKGEGLAIQLGRRDWPRRLGTHLAPLLPTMPKTATANVDLGSTIQQTERGEGLMTSARSEVARSER